MRLLTALVFFSPTLLPAQDSTAMVKRLLPAIETRCAGAKRYVLEGAITLQGQRGSSPARLLSQARVKLAVSEPGKYYLWLAPVDKDEYLLASDGRKSWAYVPKLKQYTEQESASVTASEGEEDEQEEAVGDEEHDLAETWIRQVVPILSRVARSAATADVKGSMVVKLNGKKAEWPTIRVMSKRDAQGGVSLTEINADPDTGDVGRLAWSTAQYSGNQKTVFRMVVEFSSFQIGGEIPERTFVFEPKKAKLVETLPIPGQTGSFLQNKPVPDLELKTLDGEKIRLSELKGHPVVLSFWASWCGPCRRELPVLVKLNAELKDKGLVMLGVNDEGKAIGRQYTEEAKLNFRTLDDSSMKAHTPVPGAFDSQPVCDRRRGESGEVLQGRAGRAGYPGGTKGRGVVREPRARMGSRRKCDALDARRNE